MKKSKKTLRPNTEGRVEGRVLARVLAEVTGSKCQQWNTPCGAGCTGIDSGKLCEDGI
jgi:hypothetical protein